MQIESNLGMMNDQGQFYQVDSFRVLGMESLRMGVKILRTQNLDMHWNQIFRGWV